MKRLTWLVGALALCGVTVTARAEVPTPPLIPLHGVLTDMQGKPLPDGQVQLSFRLYATEDAEEWLWQERRDVRAVEVSEGYFSVFLGEVEPLDPTLIEASPDLWLEVQIIGDDPMEPRMQFGSVPYALLASDVTGDIHPTSVSVGGTELINERGEWVGPTTGLTGPPGTDGKDGEKGDPGEKGEPGDPGEKGDQGEVGETGPPGESVTMTSIAPNAATCPFGGIALQRDLVTTYVCNGKPGKDGATGPQGIQGIQGVPGTKGDTGAAGAKGPPGDPGPPGSPGPAGNPGAPGAPGSTGPAGANGTNGTNGTNGNNGNDGLSVTVTSFSGNQHGCANGGLTVKRGTDPDQFVCNGTNGTNGNNGLSVTVTSFSGNQNGCANGGLTVKRGTDADQFVCNGTNGTNGNNGANGTDGISVAVTSFGGAQNGCANGGLTVKRGTDPDQFVCNGTNGNNGNNGNNGTNGTDGISVAVTSFGGAQNGCANGGLTVKRGTDPDQFVCNGTNGTNGTNGNDGLSVTVTSFSGNQNGCPNGGLTVKRGTDPDQFVCNGTNGTNGTNGDDGTNGTDGISVAVTSFGGAQNGCANGGLTVKRGTDPDQFVCNGTNGTNGLSVTVTSFSGNQNGCANGGLTVKRGTDPDQFVCNGTNGTNGTNGNNGTDGTNGTDGISVAVTSFGGTEGDCTNGGLKVKRGTDPDQFVCNGINGTNGTDGTDGTDGTNGTDGTDGISVTVTSFGGAEGGCINGGLKVKRGTDADQFVCNGTDGTNGTNGTDGSNGTDGADGTNGISVTLGSYSGPDCAAGGVEIFAAGGSLVVCDGDDAFITSIDGLTGGTVIGDVSSTTQISAPIIKQAGYDVCDVTGNCGETLPSCTGSNKVAIWDGSSWTCASAALSPPQPCTGPGEALQWSGTQWQCVNVRNTGLSKGQANGFEITDEWGDVWDGIQRSPKTWAGAKAACEADGGRLPTGTELWRNRGSAGHGTIGTESAWLWTILPSNNPIYYGARRLSDGMYNNDALKNSPYNYRCIWPRDKLSTSFTGNKCLGPPGNECRSKDSFFNVDRWSRPAVSFEGAQAECALMNGTVMTSDDYSDLIMQGYDLVDDLDQPASSGPYLHFSSDSHYYYADGVGYIPILEWFRNPEPWWGPDNSEVSQASSAISYRYRCIGKKDQASGYLPASPPCNGGCFELKGRGRHNIKTDSSDRPATTFTQAFADCQSAGGTLPTGSELLNLVTAGWTNGSGVYLWSGSTAVGWGWQVFRWPGTGNEWWNVNYDYNWSSTTVSFNHPTTVTKYRCVWPQTEEATFTSCAVGRVQMRDEASGAYFCVDQVNGDSQGNQSPPDQGPFIDAWGNAWDRNQREFATWTAARDSCVAKGGRLPLATELFRVRFQNGVVGTELGQSGNATIDYLWTLNPEYREYYQIQERLSDGTTQSACSDPGCGTPASTAYRCIWPATPPEAFSGHACYGAPSAPCFEFDRVRTDRYNRPSLPQPSAQWECQFLGGRLPDAREFAVVVRAGVPNLGAATNIWSRDWGYNPAWGPFVFVRGTNPTAADWQFNTSFSEGSATYEYNYYQFRCVFSDRMD